MSRIAALAVMVWVGCTGSDTPTPPDTGSSADSGSSTIPTTRTEDNEARLALILQLEGSVEAGEPLYDEFCERCHAPDGSGTKTGPSLVERLRIVDRSAVIEVTLEGRGTMASFAGALSNQELADISAYVLDAFGPAL